MQRTKNRELGDLGEEIACRYLSERGFTVLERNYWKPWGELDIVASASGGLTFFEVKTVSREIGSRVTVEPEDNLHPEKLKRLGRAVQSYLWERKVGDDTPWSLEALCVFLDMEGKTAKVQRIKDLSY